MQYGLTYAGFKEDIVVTEYTGQTQFEFYLVTNGLKLITKNGNYCLADENNKIKAQIGEVIIFTADEKNNAFGKLSYEVIEENQKYLIIISVDEEYIASEKTIYPIRIDPTIELAYDYDNYGEAAIEDITVNDTKSFSGTSGSINAGKHSDGSLSRILMKFNKLPLNNLYPSQIIEANVELRDLMCQGNEPMTIQCYSLDYDVSWTENSMVNWSIFGTNDEKIDTLQSELLIDEGNGNVEGQTQRYSFLITGAVKNWASRSDQYMRGLVFKATDSFESSSTNWLKTFCSYNRSSTYRPSLYIKYTTQVSLDQHYAEMTKGSVIQLTATSNSHSNTSITWESTAPSVANVDSAGKVTALGVGIATIKATAAGESAECVIVVKIPDGIYRIASKQYPTKCMDVRGAGTQPGTEIILYSKSNSTSTNNQYWQLKHVGNGNYKLKPMHTVGKILGFSQNKALLTSGNLSNNADYLQWTINEVNGYYYITRTIDTSKTLSIDNSSTSTVTNIILEPFSGSNRQLWSFETGYIPITNISIIPPEGLEYDDVYIELHKDYLPTETPPSSPILTANVYPNNATCKKIEWFSSDESIASINSLTGELNINGIGKATLTAFSQDHSVLDTLTLVVLDEFSYIKNSYSGKYFDVYNAETSIGTNIIQYSFHGDANQTIKLVKEGFNVFSLHPMISGNEMSISTYNSRLQLDELNLASTSALFEIIYDVSTDKCRLRTCGFTTSYAAAYDTSSGNILLYQFEETECQKWIIESFKQKSLSNTTFCAYSLKPDPNYSFNAYNIFLSEMPKTSSGNQIYQKLMCFKNSGAIYDPKDIVRTMPYADVIYIDSHATKEGIHIASPDGEDGVKYIEYNDLGNVLGENDTYSNSIFTKSTKWVICSACDQLNYQKKELLIIENELSNTALEWAKIMLGSGQSLHGVLGYYGTAPGDNMSKFGKVMQTFMDEQEKDNPKTLINSWIYANSTTGEDENVKQSYAALYREGCINDTFSSMGDTTPSGNIYLIYYDYSKERTIEIQNTSLTKTNVSSLQTNYALIDTTQASIEKKINLSEIEKSLHNNGDFQVLPEGNFKYNAFDKEITSALPMTKGPQEVAEYSLKFLEDVGLILSDDYVVSIVPIKKVQIDNSTYDAISASIVEYEVYIERKNALSKENDIHLRVQEDGIIYMNYDWDIKVTK